MIELKALGKKLIQIILAKGDGTHRVIPENRVRLSGLMTGTPATNLNQLRISAGVD